ncbi:unnamed protein product [Cylicocyclus nassatus]|uniref:Uncharacterized protein n=1 Tax=Cylicocyclus nassatus TaxID=53992 RepID=A0AA36GJC4_CYLNA|nr:unnamed protein product [Cylicocyclus nassatus]
MFIFTLFVIALLGCGLEGKSENREVPKTALHSALESLISSDGVDLTNRVGQCVMKCILNQQQDPCGEERKQKRKKEQPTLGKHVGKEKID